MRRVINLTETPPGTVRQDDINLANLVYRIEASGLVTLVKNRFTSDGSTDAEGLKALLQQAESFNFNADGFDGKQ